MSYGYFNFPSLFNQQIAVREMTLLNLLPITEKVVYLGFVTKYKSIGLDRITNILADNAVHMCVQLFAWSSMLIQISL